MILVSEIFENVQQVLGTSSSTITYNVLNRAIRLLRNKSSKSNITWDPSLIYCNIETDPGRFIVALPYQIEKPIAINLNLQPAFTRGQLFEFTMNGPGSNDPLIGWQWMDQGTKPLQVPLPFPGVTPGSPGNVLIFTSDNVGDVGIVFTCLVQLMDNSEATIPITLGVPSIAVQDLLAVNKPVTMGNIMVRTNSQIVASYAPLVINPRFHQIKISQPGSSVRILGRRRYITVSGLTDFIPLESSEAIIEMCKAVKYYDEDQISAAQACEQTSMMWMEEDNTSRMLYSVMANASQSQPILNINIYNRDSVIVGDVFEEANRIFGPMGQQNVFDEITNVIETLQNMSQWDPAIGYADIQSFGGPDGNQFYLTLPRYVEEVLAININGHPGKFHNKWFEFHMNGLFQDNSDGKFPVNAGASQPGLWTNRSWDDYQDMGEFCIAFDPLPVNTPFQLVAIAKNSFDLNTSIRVYGYDINNLPVNDTDGSEGFLVPVGTIGNLPPPNPSGANLVCIERIFRDPTSGFLDLWTCDSSGNLIQFLSTYWPDETEPHYRRIKLGTRPLTNAVQGMPQFPVVRLRYRKRWRKITALTDPIHLRSRTAIIDAMTATALAAKPPPGMDPGQALATKRSSFELAVQYLNDEWRSTHQREGLDIQVDSQLWPSVMNNFEMMT